MEVIPAADAPRVMVADAHPAAAATIRRLAATAAERRTAGADRTVVEEGTVAEVGMAAANAQKPSPLKYE